MSKEKGLMSFREWVDYYYWKGFDVDSLSDEEYYALEDEWNKYIEQKLKERGKWIEKDIIIS